MGISKLNVSEKLYLKKIGLTQKAIELYQKLLAEGPLTAREAAVFSSAFPSAEYRLFYDLEKRELVRRLSGRPLRFEALKISDGLQASLASQHNQLKQLVEAEETGKDVANIIIGRQKVYDTYIKNAQKAQSQINIYSIGIAYNKGIEETQKAAVERGVSIKHVVQEMKPSNYFVIRRWLKYGVNLRVLERPRGYHLSIIDDACAIVTFSDPNDTEHRVSMITNDKNIISIFQSQFSVIWQTAQIPKI